MTGNDKHRLLFEQSENKASDKTLFPNGVNARLDTGTGYVLWRIPALSVLQSHRWAFSSARGHSDTTHSNPGVLQDYAQESLIHVCHLLPA